VFAKDSESGIIYEGVVRKSMYGVQYQRQIRLSQTTSPEEIAAFMEQEPSPTWWYFIHFSGWNAKWDRWVREDDLYEPTESTKLFAKRLQQEVTNIRAELRSKGISNKVRVAMELESRMLQIERQHRIDERRRELAARGETMDKQEEAELLGTSNKAANSNKWNKSNLHKEFAYRTRHLQGRRSQASSELLVLPLALKKILVEEWEIIAQCDMVANLPAQVSVRDALNQYLQFKLEVISSADNRDGEIMNSHGSAKASAPEPTAGSPQDPDPPIITETSNSASSPGTSTNHTMMSPEEREWREMVHGICLFFNQAIPHRLLYEVEMIQYEELMQTCELQHCDIYGCEYLLRLLLRLPSLLTGALSGQESKSILLKLNDLVRFLQKHQSTLFLQSYRKLNASEMLRKLELSGS
jgi:mortality factor 4-like protein 1